jgi:hypothetical protein
MRSLTVLSFLLAATGCYHYTPATTPSPPQGTPLRVHLERPGSFELVGLTAHNIDRVDGEMVSRADGELVLSATWLYALTGNGFPGELWTVYVDASNIASLEERKLSWWRTGVIVLAGALGTYFGFDALYGTSASGGQGGGGTNTR